MLETQSETIDYLRHRIKALEKERAILHFKIDNMNQHLTDIVNGVPVEYMEVIKQELNG